MQSKHACCDKKIRDETLRYRPRVGPKERSSVLVFYLRFTITVTEYTIAVISLVWLMCVVTIRACFVMFRRSACGRCARRSIRSGSGAGRAKPGACAHLTPPAEAYYTFQRFSVIGISLKEFHFISIESYDLLF